MSGDFGYQSFGEATGREVEESDSTLGFSNREILQQQARILDEQDRGVEALAGSVRIQKRMAEDIGDELEVHSHLIDDLSEGVDRTTRNLRREHRRLKKLAKDVRLPIALICIVVLVIIILAIVITAVVLTTTSLGCKIFTPNDPKCSKKDK